MRTRWMRNSNQILHGDQGRPRPLPWPNFSVTRIPTRDLFAAAKPSGLSGFTADWRCMRKGRLCAMCASVLVCWTAGVRAWGAWARAFVNHACCDCCHCFVTAARHGGDFSDFVFLRSGLQLYVELSNNIESSTARKFDTPGSIISSSCKTNLSENEAFEQHFSVFFGNCSDV